MAPAGIGAELAGIHAVAAALERGRVRHITVEAPRLRHDAFASVVEAAREDGVSVDVVDDVRPHSTIDHPQGIVAAADPIPTITLDAAVAAATPAALVVLDHVEDPRNVGAVARSMLAAGIRSLVVAARRAAPVGVTAFKAAAGALEDVGVAVVNSTADAVAALAKQDVWTVGLDAAGESPLFGLAVLEAPVALVLGSEGRGLGRLVRDRLDVVARIPMAPGVESLNIAAAATLGVFEIARVRDGIS